jgi:HPt (histidine-containing phosphotransfer) domain-containing protein
MQFKHSRPSELLGNVGDDKETFLLLVDIFRRESVIIFGRMREAAAKRDLPELGRQSHSLKGTVGPLGADQLVQMLLDIEDECKQGNCICDDRRLAVIEDEIKIVGAEIDDFIRRF